MIGLRFAFVWTNAFRSASVSWPAWSGAPPPPPPPAGDHVPTATWKLRQARAVSADAGIENPPPPDRTGAPVASRKRCRYSISPCESDLTSFFASSRERAFVCRSASETTPLPYGIIICANGFWKQMAELHPGPMDAVRNSCTGGSTRARRASSAVRLAKGPTSLAWNRESGMVFSKSGAFATAAFFRSSCRFCHSSSFCFLPSRDEIVFTWVRIFASSLAR